MRRTGPPRSLHRYRCRHSQGYCTDMVNGDVDTYMHTRTSMNMHFDLFMVLASLRHRRHLAVAGHRTVAIEIAIAVPIMNITH